MRTRVEWEVGLGFVGTAMGPLSEINSYLRSRPNGLLYHYTTTAGIIGIFESRTIWATSTRHLNDSEEYLHAAKLLREEVEHRLNQETGSKRETFEQWIDSLREDRPDCFVTSFSAKSDLLSQWRAYSDCNNGYSIGFNHDELKQVVRTSDCILVKCEYRLEYQKQLITQLADFVYKMIVRSRGKGLKGPKGRGWIGRIITKSMAILASIKHPSFEEEQEWRLVALPDSRRELCFREGRFGIVPYYKVPLLADEHNRLSFSELWVGPTQNKEAAEFAATELVHRFGIPWKTPFVSLVHHSKSSLRP